ncbi:HAD family hydrolase [Pantanalinema sp. GBBB05]|uniref:HAD family hydrolase n=1 Tax=Pantanalinema sp. GBBB05 TaxID=2604139 RepID=UPI003D813C12
MMSLMPLAQVGDLSARLVATDMDGTLTIADKFTPSLLQALETLRARGIEVVIVTGRSAGWVHGLVHYLPIAGAIAENGSIYYSATSDQANWLVSISDLAQHRQHLAEVFHYLQTDFPQIQESADNHFRLTDWTFDIGELTPEDLQGIRDRCQAWGWGFTYSTVQCHIKLQQQSKATGLQQVLAQWFQACPVEQVVTVGDSPNDESLFDAELFPVSVGVANIYHYCDRLQHLPTYITLAPEGEGFCELSQRIKPAPIRSSHG